MRTRIELWKDVAAALVLALSLGFAALTVAAQLPDAIATLRTQGHRGGPIGRPRTMHSPPRR
jgi:hypothetical protein